MRYRKLPNAPDVHYNVRSPSWLALTLVSVIGILSFYATDRIHDYRDVSRRLESSRLKRYRFDPWKQFRAKEFAMYEDLTNVAEFLAYGRFVREKNPDPGGYNGYKEVILPDLNGDGVVAPRHALDNVSDPVSYYKYRLKHLMFRYLLIE